VIQQEQWSAAPAAVWLFAAHASKVGDGDGKVALVFGPPAAASASLVRASWPQAAAMSSPISRRTL